jgi:hypothetical protein
LLSLKSFVAEKRHGCKSYSKKVEKKKRVKKWTSVQDIEKMGTQMPA